MTRHVPLSIESISADDAKHVLWFFSDHNYEPGSFTQALLKALHKADTENFKNLALGFPGLCAAFHIAKTYPTGIEILQSIWSNPNKNVVAAAEAIVRGDN